MSRTAALSQQQLAYSILAMSWWRDRDHPMLTQSIRLSTDIEAAAMLRLSLSAGATLTRLGMLDTIASTDPQASTLRHAGDQRILSFDAREGLSYEWGGFWRADQSFVAAFVRPLGDEQTMPESRTLTLDAALFRLWARDQGGLRGRMGVVSAASYGTQPAQPARDFESAQLQLAWRHEWTPTLSHDVAAGAGVVYFEKATVLPAGSANLTWRRDGNELELRASHGADASVFMGTIYKRSLVGLRGNFTLDRQERLGLLGNIDLEHATMLTTSAEGSGSGSANVLFTRVALNWRPGDMFVFGLEYTFRDQRSSPASTGTLMSASFRRQMVMLTVEMQYPTRLQ